jgi:predicted O-methyltransferase YrrM
LVSQRLLPVRAILRDPLAYHAVGTWTFGELERIDVTQVFPGIEEAEVILANALGGSVETSLTVHEAAVLCAIVRFTHARRILEVGTYDGRTALNLAANSPVDGMITTIDLPAAWNRHLALDVPSYAMNVTSVPALGLKYRDTPYAHRIRQVYGDSAVLDWSTLGVPFDVVFIDGCHSYEYVKSDTQKALASVRRGGLLIWHDYGMIEDVSRVVDETASLLRVHALRSTSFSVGFVG